MEITYENNNNNITQLTILTDLIASYILVIFLWNYCNLNIYFVLQKYLP